jgi:hypothetical protein
MKKLLALLLVFGAAQLSAQQFGQVGTSGAQLLKINCDPRASALGYAAASVVNNSAAVFTNIAGTGFVEKADVSFAYTPWFADLKIMSAAGAYHIRDIGVVSVHFAGFNTDEEITTVEQENGTGERYSISNMTVGVGIARYLMEGLIVGFGAKYYSESYYGHSASAIAFDIGTNYSLGFANSRLALVLQNFGPNVRALSGSYTDYSDSYIEKDFNSTPLPVTFRFSFSTEPFVGDNYRIRFIADLAHPNDNVEHYNIGSEVLLLDFLALRGGIKLNYDDETFALGVGINGGKFLGEKLRIDYSYENFKILSSVQKISVGFEF